MPTPRFARVQYLDGDGAVLFERIAPLQANESRMRPDDYTVDVKFWGELGDAVTVRYEHSDGLDDGWEEIGTDVPLIVGAGDVTMWTPRAGFQMRTVEEELRHRWPAADDHVIRIAASLIPTWVDSLEELRAAADIVNAESGRTPN